MEKNKNKNKGDRQDLIEGSLITAAGGITLGAGIHTLLQPQMKWEKGLWLRKILNPLVLGLILTGAGLYILFVGIRKLLEYLRPSLPTSEMANGITTAIAGVLATAAGALIVIDDFPDLGGDEPGHRILEDLQRGHLHHYLIGILLFLLGLVITFLGGARVIYPYLGTGLRGELREWKEGVKEQYLSGHDLSSWVEEGVKGAVEGLDLPDDEEVGSISREIIGAITA